MLYKGFTHTLLHFPTCLPKHYTRQVGLLKQVLTPAEQVFLLRLCHLKLRGTPFHPTHFDGVIQGYREITASHWQVGRVDPQVRETHHRHARTLLDRCQSLLESIVHTSLHWLPEHVLELNTMGTIGPHTDHPTASGRMIGVLGLMSNAPVVFTHKDHPEYRFELVSEPGSLYYQFDDFRYEFQHSVPKPPGHSRVSVMFRDQPTSNDMVK